MNASTSKKILVVDDSATMRMFIAMTLRKMAAVSVIEAVNGLEALEKMQQQEIDMVLTDIVMPEMDGIELIRKIRGSLHKKIPIIVISTKGREEDRDLGLSLGANGYITKPLKGQELTEAVNKFLSIS